MIRPAFLAHVALLSLLAGAGLGCADTSPPGAVTGRTPAAPPPDADPPLWWDAGPDDAGVTLEAAPLESPAAGPPRRTRLVSFATPPLWLGGALTGRGALLVWDAGDASRHDLVALPVSRDGKAAGAPRPVLSGPGALTSALVARDWRRDVVLVVADTTAGTRAARLDAAGAPLGPVVELAAAPSANAAPVASAALRTREGFLLAHADGPDTVAVTALQADATAPLASPHRLHLPGTRRLQLADTGEARFLAFDGPETAGLRRLDVDAPPLPWRADVRTDLLADGDGLLAVTCLGDLPGEPGAVVAERLDADGRPRGAPRMLAKSAVPCDFAAHLRPAGGLALRHGRHVTRFDAALQPTGEPAYLPEGSLPGVLLWARDTALACGLSTDAEGETLDCLALTP
jgi:hypothetical protein